ncbi:type III polyketide synthase [Bacillus sp. V5-8f]|nr:3-oxoacyl-[acyl-carrier-protein] synthase III C-terminal domain-containing protein [Bacillus sp. V5-8f]PLT35264.1 type III polyketide synthase [Bacillus sp. V5-8f]
MEFAREMFGSSYKNLERLLRVFKNGQVKTRYFSKNIEWFNGEHSFEETNEVYMEQAVHYGCQAVVECLGNLDFLQRVIEPEEINAFFYISSTGLATPTIDARIMNLLPFRDNTKRIPIWGLGCAGGAAGLSRAFEYCKAFPDALALVLCVELCSLTFQKDDVSKSNIIGTSLFSDGIGCALIAGDEVQRELLSKQAAKPNILSTRSTLMRDSLDVMGWDVKDKGLHVVFSKDIPTIIKEWLKPNVEGFLTDHGLSLQDVEHFIAHPGGMKVIQAYEEALGFDEQKTEISMKILQDYGNMSSATILYVLEQFLHKEPRKGDYGLAAALGPGFSSELLLMRWE